MTFNLLLPDALAKYIDTVSNLLWICPQVAVQEYGNANHGLLYHQNLYLYQMK